MRKALTSLLLAAAAATPTLAQTDDVDRRSPRNERQQFDGGRVTQRQDARPDRGDGRGGRGEARAQPTAPAPAALAQVGNPAGRGELRRDRQELRQDRRELFQQRQDLQRNRAEGDVREARRDRAELVRDRQELRADRQELRSDRRGDQPGFADRRDDRRDVRQDRRDNRQDYRDNRRDGRNDGRFGRPGSNGGAWNNSWRNDGRYDWQRYRSSNRGFYSLPRYYAPGGFGYGYRRYGVGIRIGAPFYADRYWISDPFAYRLPPAYGPYRWVRYYDDVLLIDIYTGVVRDAIYGFFY